jgi:hypothetical protein
VRRDKAAAIAAAFAVRRHRTDTEPAGAGDQCERGEIGPDLFQAAGRMGLEGWSPSIAIGPIRRVGRSIG